MYLYSFIQKAELLKFLDLNRKWIDPDGQAISDQHPAIRSTSNLKFLNERNSQLNLPPIIRSVLDYSE